MFVRCCKPVLAYIYLEIERYLKPRLSVAYHIMLVHAVLLQSLSVYK